MVYGALDGRNDDGLVRGALRAGAAAERLRRLDRNHGTACSMAAPGVVVAAAVPSDHHHGAHGVAVIVVACGSERGPDRGREVEAREATPGHSVEKAGPCDLVAVVVVGVVCGHRFLL